jgi:hypothetical protein
MPIVDLGLVIAKVEVLEDTALSYRLRLHTNGNVIDTPNLRGVSFKFGVCSTAAGTADKAVSLSNFSLATGAEVTVLFTAVNTAENPTLNVNGSGAKPICYSNAAIDAGMLAANSVLSFVYDGAQWELIEPGAATASASGLMSATDKSKLDGIAAGAQVNPGAATTAAPGLMSATDKSKLDGIAAGAQVNPGAATASASGLMSATDKSKLDGIAAGAQVNPSVKWARDNLQPVGTYYTQYPAAASNDPATAFPEAERPGTLFGGNWATCWESEQIFFRTGGSLAADAGRNSGYQENASHQISGTVTNIVSAGGTGVTGAFYINSTVQASIYNGGVGYYLTIGIDSTKQYPQDGSESRPKNRRIIVWRKYAL